jgi:hypothetical protein
MESILIDPGITLPLRSESTKPKNGKGSENEENNKKFA